MSGHTRTIVHILYRLGVGGLENGLVNVVNGLPRDRIRHVIICLAGYDSFSDRLKHDDVELIDIGKRPGKDPASYLRVYRALRAIRPDVVHTRNIAALDCQFLAAILRVPLRIHSEHGWDAADPAGVRASHRLLRRLSRGVVHRYMVVSRHMVGWLKSVIGIPESRICQIYNGIDCERFSPAPEDSGLQQEQFGIVTVGRLDPIKNQALLLDAFARLLRTLRGQPRQVHLTLVGGGVLDEELRARAKRLGLEKAVSFLGSVNDVPAVLRKNHVFVLPSLNEGISNTVLEAMASGLPVIASDVGGNPELVVDGETGKLFASGDVSALCDHLASYLHDPALRRRHGRQARQRAIEHFSMESMLENYSRLYGLWQPAENYKEA